MYIHRKINAFIAVILAAALMMCEMMLAYAGIGFEQTYAKAAKKPAKVSGLSVKRNGTGIKATWKKAKNAKKYQVYVKIGTSAWKLKKTLAKRSFAMEGQEGKTYSFRVRGVNGKKKGSFSAVKKVSIPAPEPEKPEEPEEPADDDGSVTVYLTLSKDSDFIVGKDPDHTVIARVPVKLSYVDLAKYGLERFYRYEADSFEDGGNYKKPFVLLERPTALMLLIKALEKWYFVREMTPEDAISDAFNVEGSGACSMFMNKFWDHDCNLMYFHNKQYPLMRKGWGATADYIIMEEGDEFDLAMFTDWGFMGRGAFVRFSDPNPQLEAGEECTLQMAGAGTIAGQDGESVDRGVFPNEYIKISTDKGKTWKEKAYKTDYKGEVTVSFDKPGVYYITAGPKFTKQGEADPCMAPPVSVAEVSPAKIYDYSAKAASSTSVKYTWENMDGAVRYQVAYQKSGDSKWTTFTTDRNEAEVTDLTEGAVYNFKVLAISESDYVPEGEPNKALMGPYSEICKVLVK